MSLEHPYCKNFPPALRYRIEPYGQQMSAHEGMCAKECYPCLRHHLSEEEKAKRKGAGKFIWDVMRSEVFLLSLHMLVLILGIDISATPTF